MPTEALGRTAPNAKGLTYAHGTKVADPPLRLGRSGLDHRDEAGRRGVEVVGAALQQVGDEVEDPLGVAGVRGPPGRRRGRTRCPGSRSRIARVWPLQEAAASAETCVPGWCRSGAAATEMTSRTRHNKAVTCGDELQ